MYSHRNVLCELLLLSFLIVFPLATQDEINPYCEISSCANPAEHTMCVHKVSGEGTACAGLNYQKGSELNKKEKLYILAEHNIIRSGVATGNLTARPPFGMGLPPGKNLNELFWDDELEMIAQRWADQCNATKDKCRNTATYPAVGQVIFTNIWNPNFEPKTNVDMLLSKGAVAAYTEPIPIDSTDTDIKSEDMKALVQVLWANADALGCARAIFGKGEEGQTDFIVCNYGDGGVLGGPTYKRGSPCADCLCSTYYRGLCAKAEAKDLGVSLFLLSATPLLVFGLS